MPNKLDFALKLVDELYPEQPHPDYGTKEQVKAGMVEFYEQARQRANELSPTTKMVAIGWAGIGDALYSRLITQHLILDHELTWIAPPMVAGLYKDDDLVPVLSGFSSPYRDVRRRWVRAFSGAIHELCETVFKEHRMVYISRAASRYWPIWATKPTNYADLFLTALGIERDPSVVCTLKHNGVPTIPLPERYVVLEKCSITFGSSPIGHYTRFVESLAQRGVGVVLVGGKNEQMIDGAIDAKGMDLYDTFSIIKGAAAFVGVSSGNESLTAFLPELKLFEVEIPPQASFAVAMRPRNFYRVRLSTLAADVLAIL